MASSILTRTPSSAGNRKTWTWSGWVKRSSISGNQCLMTQVDAWQGNSNAGFYLISGSLTSYNFTSSLNAGGSSYNRPSLKLRDVNGWYHIVVRLDTTQSTASDRLRWYVNGTQQTDFDYSNYPSLNQDCNFNNTSPHGIGGHTTGGSYYFDGSMAHVHFCDGQSYAPTEFGETDSTTGIWKPKIAPSVTYGTNGFFLKFENSGSMGTDSSGNANNFTVNGTPTQTIDTPSNVFAALNPLARRLTGNDPTYLNGNTSLQGQTVDGQNNNAIATLGDLAKGKYYFECKVGNVAEGWTVGISQDPDPLNGGATGSYYVQYKYDGTKFIGGSYTSYGATYTTGDIIGVAFDVTAGTIQFYKNGVSQGTASSDLATNLGNGYTPVGFTNKGLMHFNFGNGYFGTTAVSSAQNPTDGIGIFEYTPPTNYRAVCTKSINAQEYS